MNTIAGMKCPECGHTAPEAPQPGRHTSWEVKGMGHNVYVETVDTALDGGFICDLQADEFDTATERARIDATAAYIVTACNAHDDLLSACHGMVGMLQGLEEAEGTKFLGVSVDAMNAAIAKAEGR